MERKGTRIDFDRRSTARESEDTGWDPYLISLLPDGSAREPSSADDEHPPPASPPDADVRHRSRLLAGPDAKEE
jgi:hypothetical protein